MSTSNIALITGASGGIGMEFARIHAAKGGDLVIVARSENKLNELKSELESKYGVTVWVIAEDLSGAGSAKRIYDKTKELGLDVGTLINNAGFGGHGFFHERELEKEQSMIQLNITTLTDMTHFFLKDMVKANTGRILNVSSTASFMPGPLQAVYYATKAYVTSFSLAVAEEVSNTDITVTALCPGAVATGFVAAGDLEGVEVFDKARSPASVAEVGYRDMEKGKLLSFNEGKLQFLLGWVIPLLPKKLVLKISRQTMEKTR